MKIISTVLVAFLLTSCIRVDVCRWVVTPTIDPIMKNHGFTYSAPEFDVAELPNGAELSAIRISDDLVDISVTRLNVQGQETGIVYCGGNGFRQGNIGKAVFTAFEPLQSTLIFDYPGYGNSGGEATFQEFDRATDLLAEEIERWRERSGFESILFWGKSFGGTICARVAAHYSGDSRLVLETTYNDMQSLVKSKAGIFKKLIHVNLDPRAPDFHISESLRNFSGPVAVLMSADDPVTPAKASRYVAQLLKEQGVDVQLIDLGNLQHRSLLSDRCASEKVLPTFDTVIRGLRAPPCRSD